MGNGASECEWRPVPEARRGFGEIWKSQLVELKTGHRTRRVVFRGSLRLDEFVRYGRYARWGRGRWKSQNRKNVYISPSVEEPLNLKVIKSFVLELRSRNVFFVFQDSYVLCIYVMNCLCTFHISVLWVWYIQKIFYRKYASIFCNNTDVFLKYSENSDR